MQNSKLMQLLQTFSSSEMNEFRKFVNSPFHNESPMLIKLYDFLEKYSPTFDHKDITKENAYQSIYGKAKYNDKKLRDRLSDMLALANSYLVQIELKFEPSVEWQLILRQLRERKLDKHFNSKYLEAERSLTKTPVLNSNYFLDRYTVFREMCEFYENRKLLGKRRDIYSDLDKEVEFFILFFTSQMLSYFTTMYNWGKQVNHKFKFKFYSPVMKFAAKNNLDEYPQIKALYLILKMAENEDDKDLYYQLKELFVKNMFSFDHFEGMKISSALFNDALRRYLKGGKEFYEERFEILKLQLQSDTYPREEGWITREQYINCVLIPLDMGKTEWVEKFISEYAEKVVPDKRKDASFYVNALLNFSREEYNSSLEQLSQIEDIDYIYYVRIKTMQAKIYYEQSDTEKVLSVIDSFKHYMTSNTTVPPLILKRYTNFVNMLYKLIMLSMTKDEFGVKKLKKEIESFSFDELTSNKTWLLEKVEEL